MNEQLVLKLKTCLIKLQVSAAFEATEKEGRETQAGAYVLCHHERREIHRTSH